MTSISHRIYEVIQHKGMSIRAFESQAGITQGVISNAIKKDSDISSTNLMKIINTYDELDTRWLVTGEGAMLKSDNESPLKPVKQTFAREIKTSDPDFTYIDNDNAGKVPIITELGFVNFDRDDPNSYTVEDYYYIKEFRNADFLIRVSGDAMAPRYKTGDLVACRKIDMQTFWQWGKIHAIVTCNQGLMIRRIMPGEETNDQFVELRADNPAYPPIDIVENEILAFALVVGSISID